MGIPNLLNFVKNACRPANMDEFRGQTVAVDMSCLLHRGVFGCVLDIALGKQTEFYVHYCMKYIEMLLDHHCRVIAVFDGASLPAKKNTDTARRERRRQAKARAQQLLTDGKTTEAVQLLQTATEITFDIVLSVIKRCRLYANVDYLVAPYESDAQLAYLCQQNIAQLAITEDSDLIVFGVEKILFKLDARGSCTLYEKSKLPLCLKWPSVKSDFTKFRRICILSGCDYLPDGLAGIGLTKAAKFFAKTSTSDLKVLLPRIPRYLSMPSLTIPADFVTSFIQAEQTFLHQVVFDPITRRRRPLNSYANDEDTTTANSSTDENAHQCSSSTVEVEQCSHPFSFAGSMHPDSPRKQLDLAVGNRNPHTTQTVQETYDVTKHAPVGSIWHDNFLTDVSNVAYIHDAGSVASVRRSDSAVAASAFVLSEHPRLVHSASNVAHKPSPTTTVTEERPVRARVSSQPGAYSSTWRDLDVAKIYGIQLQSSDVKTKDETSVSRTDSATTISSYFPPVGKSTQRQHRNPFKLPRKSTPDEPASSRPNDVSQADSNAASNTQPELVTLTDSPIKNQNDNEKSHKQHPLFNSKKEKNHRKTPKSTDFRAPRKRSLRVDDPSDVMHAVKHKQTGQTGVKRANNTKVTLNQFAYKPPRVL